MVFLSRSGIPSLACTVLLLAAAPAVAQDEKDSPRPERKRVLGAPLDGLPRRMDFGPLEDGKEKSHSQLERQGWVYLFDSRIPAKKAWDPLGLWRVRNPEASDRNLWSVAEESGERILKNTVTEGKHGTDLISKQSFWDFDIHAEIRVPEHSNSGIYLRGRYEIQIASTPPKDKQERVPAGGLGGIYSIAGPKVNASKGPGVWQTIDASIRGFRILTVRLNGEVIHEGLEIPEARRKGTGSELSEGDGVSADPESPGPIFLQGDHGSVELRNIRVRPAGFPGLLRGPRPPVQLRKDAVIEKDEKKTETKESA